MAKRSQRRPVRYDKDQLGCMWGFMSFFDFRLGRSSQKLLQDRRRGGRHAAGAVNPRSKLHLLTFNENDQGIFDGEESKTAAAVGGKPSVKKLMEEEMFNELDTKKEIENAEVEPKHSDSEQGSHKKKSRKRTNKIRSKSYDNIHYLDAPEKLRTEQPCHHNSELQSTRSLDINSVMEEFCNQIHQESICSKHDQPGQLHVQSNQKNPDFEEKLSEAIKLLLKQKLIKGKHLTEDGKTHPSKELMDALQILDPDGELFLKHLEDPNSLLAKCIQNFPDAELEKDEDSKSFARSNLSNQELGTFRQSDELVNHKHRNFFRRKVKSQESSPSNANKGSQASNRIVILKPGPTGLQNPETESSIGSSPDTHYIIRNKGPSDRIGSHFFLTEIKRKWKNAMGKEHHRTCSDGALNGFSYENVGMNSPTKDHFFIEKFSRPAGVKKGDKTSKLKDREIGTEHKSAELPKQRVSNIYVEAKKHLSEMLANGDENLDSSSGQVSKTLGRILSLPEYNFSPVGSPGRNLENSFVTAQMRYSDSDKLPKVDESTSSLKEGSHVSHLGQKAQRLEFEPSVSHDNTDNNVQAPNSNSVISDEQIHDDDVEKASSSTGDEICPKGDMEIIKTNAILVQEESNALDASCEQSSTSSTIDDDQNGDESAILNGERYSKCMKQDSSEENEILSSPLASPSNSSVTKRFEDQENASDILERPSPVSVLEPLFTEDDISPASTNFRSGVIPVQPLRIQFEDHDSSTAGQSTPMKSSIEGKESTFEYVKAVLQASGFNWDEFHMKSLSTDQLLELSLFDEVQLFPSQLCDDQKLLFDGINEILMEVCGHYFGCSPWVSFVKPNVRPVPNMKNALREVWEGVLWNLLPLPLPRTLDQIVNKDLTKSGTWMDLRFDTESFGTEMGEAILQELMEDTILSCVNECPVLPTELKESESSINLESEYPMHSAGLKEKESCIDL